MKKRIMVMVKKPGEAAYVEPMFENTLEAFQKAVGGYIETYTLAKDIVLVCNEEGKLIGLPYNLTIGREDFVGTVVAVGIEGDDFASLRASTIPAVRMLLGG